jgi:hypothetical protein
MGQHLTMTGDNTAAVVLKTGRRARIDGYAVATGPIAEIVTELGVTSTVSCPVAVKVRLWGMIRGRPGGTAVDAGHRGSSGKVHRASGNRDRQRRGTCRPRCLAGTHRGRERPDTPALGAESARRRSATAPVAGAAVRSAQAMIPTDLDARRQQPSRIEEGHTDVLTNCVSVRRPSPRHPLWAASIPWAAGVGAARQFRSSFS